eukprot:CAMPEP_0206611210 /NCGR_PEP_ID=MMETSP0325_2-20121206/55095_1 /ASSEMBLY_ACC=CAM_ASM_000347 /TAXON_ID=2866 /ORGANISM="Crypthecodinium cohnii, Strain Seligo" /LENGTH=71 /DNA_ID=CAMNT_0054130341 /DNA_START=23 /DNA_END=239 /DNA_ORIENTATION=-
MRNGVVHRRFQVNHACDGKEVKEESKFDEARPARSRHVTMKTTLGGVTKIPEITPRNEGDDFLEACLRVTE